MSYSYDANGNTLIENNQGTLTEYGCNSQNQLITHANNGFNTEYQYNADGIRHAQSDGTNAKDYFVDSNRSYAQVLAEVVNGSTSMARTYVVEGISHLEAGCGAQESVNVALEHARRQQFARQQQKHKRLARGARPGLVRWVHH